MSNKTESQISLQQYRIINPDTGEYSYSGGTPSMLAGFFKRTAAWNTASGMTYERVTPEGKPEAVSAPLVEAYRVENERLRAVLKRALELLVDIDSTLFHHNHEVVGWHKNDAGEPIMNFVSDFDMDAIKEIESALSQNT